MATIKIPGTIHIDKIDTEYSEDESIYEHITIEELHERDPLDNNLNKDIDFIEDEEPNEHADINIDEIAGNENGYDTPSDRLEQEIKLAEHDAENNKIEESLRHRIRITALSNILYSPNHWKISKFRVDLAHCYLDLMGSRYAAICEEHASEALKSLSMQAVEIFNEKEGSEYLQTLISAHYALARAQLILKKCEESQHNIDKALLNLNKLEKLSVLTEEELFPISLKLTLAAGKICLRLQKLVAASNYYNMVCNLIQTSQGEDSVELIPIYQFLGKIEQSNGKLSNHPKAIEYYLKAHTLANKHYESHSGQVIQSSRAVATAYSIIGTNESKKSAESYLKECIQSLIINHGENNPLVCEINTDLARLLLRSDRKFEALSKLKSNLKKEKELFGQYSEPVLTTCQLLGSLQLSSGSIKDALKYFKEGLIIEELQNGPNSKAAQSIKESINAINSQSNKAISIGNNKPPFSATSRPK